MTASGSGLGAQSAIDVLTAKRTATGSGLGTESATGNRVVPVFQRTASGSGLGTQTAVGNRFRRTTRSAEAVGAAYNIDGNLNRIFTQGNTTNRAGQSFKGKGTRLDSVSFTTAKNVTPIITDAYAEIYAHSGTYGVNGKPIGSPLAISNVTSISVTSFDSIIKPTTFIFSGANRIILENNTPYFAVYYSLSGQSTLIWLTRDNHSGNSSYFDGSVWLIGTGDHQFYVNGSSATGRRVVNRTSTGSGSGTATSLEQIPPVGINWSYWGTNALLTPP